VPDIDVSASACTHACRIHLRFDLNSDTNVDLVVITRDQLTVANLLIAIGAQRPSLAASTSSPSSYGNPALWTPSSTHRLPMPSATTPRSTRLIKIESTPRTFHAG